MNDRWGNTPQSGDGLQTESAIAGGPANVITRPGMNRRAAARAAYLEQPHMKTAGKNGHARPVARSTNRRCSATPSAIVRRDHAIHVIAEDYSYKTEAYYTILRHELAGEDIRPLQPCRPRRLCRAHLPRTGKARRESPSWNGASRRPTSRCRQSSTVLNYFATASDFFVVQDNEQAKDVVKHITNKGKYPFCYQKLGDGATIHTCTAVFGRTTGSCAVIGGYAKMIYDLFAIPLVSMVFVKTGKELALSSLAPTRYTHLTVQERDLLAAYRDEQEFL